MFPKKERRSGEGEECGPRPPRLPPPQGALKLSGETWAHMVGQQSPGKVQTWAPGTLQEEGTVRSTGGGRVGEGSGRRRHRTALGLTRDQRKGAPCEGQPEPGSEFRVRGWLAAKLGAAPTLGSCRPSAPSLGLCFQHFHVNSHAIQTPPVAGTKRAVLSQLPGPGG